MPKILVVEDNESLLATLKAKLVKEGYEVATAKDGEEALERLKEKPDGVLLDVLLPKKTGIEVLEEMQASPELLTIPIIIISNSGRPVEIELARRLGARDFLIKTDFTPQDVLAKLALYVPPPIKTRAPDSSGRESRGLILVVEDDSFLRRLIIDKLKRGGFDIGEATNGKEAMSFLAEHIPALILLDLIMPGVDGFHVLEDIRKDKRLSTIPVIVLSNLGEQEHIDRAKNLGANDYLVKAHFILDEIIDRINQIISKVP